MDIIQDINECVKKIGKMPSVFKPTIKRSALEIWHKSSAEMLRQQGKTDEEIRKKIEEDKLNYNIID